jgi:hypothetical protein
MLVNQFREEILTLRKKIRQEILIISHDTSNKDFIGYVESALTKPYLHKFNIWSALYLFKVNDAHDIAEALEELFEAYFGLAQTRGI